MADKPTRLLFDARYIRTDFHDGISRYSAELAAAVAAAAADFDTDVVFLIHDERQRDFLPVNARVLRVHAPTSVLEPFTALRLRRFKPDVLFSPMQTIGSFGRNYGLILTLHDTIYYRHRTPPKDLAWPIRLGWRLFHLAYWPQRLVLDGADSVATVSQSSKAEFARVKLTKRPVVVVANAPQKLAELLDETVSPLGVEEHPFSKSAPQNLVYMGSFMPYKNVETLIAAAGLLPGRRLHLLSRISPQRRADFEILAAEHGAELVFHNGVSDAEYAEILADDAVLVTASRDEGYGLPVAEALGFGVAAVVSDLPIFREVAGGGALYADPDDPDAFAKAILRLDDESLVAQLRADGLSHIAQYTWDESARALLAEVSRVEQLRQL